MYKKIKYLIFKLVLFILFNMDLVANFIFDLTTSGSLADVVFLLLKFILDVYFAKFT